jgi:hypothetical protein
MNRGTVTVRRISRKARCQPRLPVTANVAVRGNTVYKVILPGSTSSRTRKPPEEWFYDGNHKFVDEESIGGTEFRWESPAHGR